MVCEIGMKRDLEEVMTKKWLMTTSGRHGSVHFCRLASLVNASSTQLLTRANATCFAWTAAAFRIMEEEPSVHSVSPCFTKTTVPFRRSSYHDVIRVAEIQKYNLDITGVQTYVINSAKIVFLNERPQPRPGKGVTNTCHVCQRSLLDSFSFCSLGCKIVGTSAKFRRNKRRFNSEMGGSDSEESSMAIGIGNAAHVVRSKIQSFTPSTPPQTQAALNIMRSNKRRKGVPHRAPVGGLNYRGILLK
ncbi:hypothetical protein RJ640_028430 [Escallonia rubra]|uniref:PLATZ transcription factor family protein n=1 Tax=Escallonia rubra TaxID=112253 RepID=A0AA88R8I2_9ASTE|nr:hypothetical protein RJ640_028430 [Escallonia rubra]